MNEKAIREGYEQFKAAKSANQLAEIAETHGLEAPALQKFVSNILQHKIFDGEQLSDLLAPRVRLEIALKRGISSYGRLNSTTA